MSLKVYIFPVLCCYGREPATIYAKSVTYISTLSLHCQEHPLAALRTWSQDPESDQSFQP